MDPTANLDEQRRLAKRLTEHDYQFDDTEMVNDGYALAELVLALDEWISKGGFLPDSWEKQQKS